MSWLGVTATWSAGTATLSWAGDPYGWPPDGVVSEWVGQLVVAVGPPVAGQREYQLL